MHEGSITIRITASVSEIERLNRLVRQFGELHELPSRILYAVNLALDEAVTNVVLHGYEGKDGGKVAIRIDIADGRLTATVEDAGLEFDPLSLPTPNLQAPLEERAIGGLGIHLMRSLMDEVAYSRRDSLNVLTLRKRIR